MLKLAKQTARQILLSLALLTHASIAFAQDTYTIDRTHTEVIFGWSHLGVSLQHGEFTNTSGKLTITPDQPEDASIEIVIDASSVSTGVTVLDSELKGSRYFRAVKFPEIQFRSTSVELTGDDTATVNGELTLRGITKEVALDAKLTFRGTHPYYGGDWLGFHAVGELDPSEFGVSWNMPGMASIEIHTELKKQ